LEKYVYKLTPHFSKKIWGWEKWNLSCHPDGRSTIENGIYKGRYLCDVIDHPESFPILVKILNSDTTLSLQVHPGDEYANLHENDNGKTECWYILGAKSNATLIVGLVGVPDKDFLRRVVAEDRIQEYVRHVNVARGDLIYIPSGTVHTLESGIRLIEVQQSSNVTYRLHDWGRGRELHVEKSLDVIDVSLDSAAGKILDFKRLDTPHFTVEKVVVSGRLSGFSGSSFHSYTVAGGVGEIEDESGCTVSLEPESTVFIPDNIGYTIFGSLELIRAY